MKHILIIITLIATVVAIGGCTQQQESTLIIKGFDSPAITSLSAKAD